LTAGVSGPGPNEYANVEVAGGRRILHDHLDC
jgi:hypothetical protein